MLSAYRSAKEALRLRAWALELLAAPSGQGPPPPHAPPRVWDLFLRAEACALPLRARLGASPLAGWLAGEEGRVLAARATVELQRVLSARALLRTLGAAAAARGWRVAVLKGGAAVGAGLGLDLSDLDLYASRDVAEAVAGVLDASGYAPGGGSGSHRLPERGIDHALPVEVHFAVPGLEPGPAVLERAPPCAGAPGMLRLAPADQLWHLLQHVVVQHHERRARIRDLLLVGAAVDDCSPAEREEVQRFVAAHRYRGALEAVLRLVGALRGECAPADPFRRLAAGMYLLRGWFQPLRLPHLVAGRLYAAVYWRLADDDGGGPGWVDPGFGLGMPSGFRALAWLHRRAPVLDGAVRRVLRTAPTWAMAPAAVAVAFAARRAAAEPGA